MPPTVPPTTRGGQSPDSGMSASPRSRLCGDGVAPAALLPLLTTRSRSHSPTEETMTHSASFSAPGAGIELNAIDAVHTMKIGSGETDGLYELFEIHVPRGHAVPPHRHGWLELYYVLSGRLTAQVDGAAHDL